jgi:chemotaxis methyl-accepting protein methylase
MAQPDAAYAVLFKKVERELGFRGSLYRQRCLRRRVAVRMRALGVRDLREYLAVLDRDPAEYERLLRTLTINVSKFFRNAETWEVIRRAVLPDVLGRSEPLVVWSAGSAAGEEAYSAAILMWEWHAMRGEAWGGHRVVGTDIDRASLEAARRAEYAEAALSETPARLRRRWFRPCGDVWRLAEPVRSLVEFRRHDILAGRPDFDADLILCRNLLIYLDRPAQDRVFEVFIETLRPGGYLVLGRVEMLGAAVRPRFEVVDLRERVYRKL